MRTACAVLTFLPGAAAAPLRADLNMAAAAWDGLKEVQGWKVAGDQDAAATVQPFHDKDRQGIVVDFDLKKGTWVNVGKPVELDLTAAGAYEVDVRWEGEQNGLQLKVEDAGGNTHGALLAVPKDKAQEWTTVRLDPASLKYWWGGDNNMDWTMVRQLSFAVSKVKNGPAGKGRVYVGGLKISLPAGKELAPPRLGGWRESPGFFRLKDIDGRKLFVDPMGKPFYSKGMVYAYGPDRGPLAGRLTYKHVQEEFKVMKQYGFNTVNLYGQMFLREVLNWCEANEMALYFRTSYTDMPGLTGEQREFPDFMDPKFRDGAKKFYEDFLNIIKDYRCVLAVDMDQRWLFNVDWPGQKRDDVPRLGPAGVRRFPRWLEERFRTVSALNKAWGKGYRSFDDVLSDEAIVQNGKMRPLGENPWRLEVVNYVLWTINDFLKDLTAAMRRVDPNHLITYTSELSETIPFPLSTPQNSGVDFISPVHYNFQDDFERDWMANARLLVHLKWYYDMAGGMPQYVSETGFRTSPLAQRPPSLGYAAVRANDEQHMAELYVEQAAVMNVYPWLTGWSYFMWFDKWLEGDFGFLRNDRTPKPIALAGSAATGRLPFNRRPEDPEPRYWFYYPEYLVASPKSGFPAYKTLITLLERPFLTQVDEAVAELRGALRQSLQSLSAGLKIFRLDRVFNETWVPFKFVKALPDDDKPVVLAGETLENLSAADRDALSRRRTLTMARVGLRDERFKKTSPWFLDAVGIPPDQYQEKVFHVDLRPFCNHDGIKARADAAPRGDEPVLSAESFPRAASLSCGKDEMTFRFPPLQGPDNVGFKGQRIKIAPGYYSQAHFLVASSRGNRVARVELEYEDGTRLPVLLGPTVPEVSEAPVYGHSAVQVKGLSGGASVSMWIPHVSSYCRMDKKLVAVRLPQSEGLHLYGLSLVKGGVLENIPVTVRFKGKTFSGLCSWVQALHSAASPGYKVVAQFDNGAPAVVRSKDGRHTAFLFDALGWKNAPEEMSLNVTDLAALVYSCLEEAQP